MKKINFRNTIIIALTFIISLIFSACSIDKKVINTELEINSFENETKENEIIPIMMTDSEKELLGIEVYKDVQVLAKNEDGLIASYRIIATDDDVEINPKEILKSLHPAFRKMAVFEGVENFDLDSLILEIAEEEAMEQENENIQSINQEIYQEPSQEF